MSEGPHIFPDVKPAKEYVITNFAHLVGVFEAERKRRGWNYQNIHDRHKATSNTNLLGNMVRTAKDLRATSLLTLCAALDLEFVIRRKPRTARSARMYEALRSTAQDAPDIEGDGE